MVQFTITPKSGIKADAKDIQCTISGLPKDGTYRARFENGTLRKYLKVKDNPGGYVVSDGDSDKMSGKIDLSIPENSSESSYSIFATVEKKQKKGWEPISLLSESFDITKEKSSFEGKINIKPNFITSEDSALITVDSKPNMALTVAINDKRYVIRTDDKGKGQRKIQGSDISTVQSSKSVLKYNLNVYTEEDNYIEAKTSDAYLNIIPESIAMHISDPVSSDDGLDILLNNTIGTAPTIGKAVPRPDGIDNSSCSVGTATLPEGANFDLCRLIDYDKATLANGQNVIAALAHDEKNNDATNLLSSILVYGVDEGVPVVFDGGSTAIVSTNDPSTQSEGPTITPTITTTTTESELDTELIAYVTESTFSRLVIGDTLKVEIEGTEYSLPIIEKLPPDEYNTLYRLVLESSGLTLLQIQYCIDTKYELTDTNAKTNFNSSNSFFELPPILDENGDERPVIHIAVATHYYYPRNDYTSYVYIIAEAIVSGVSQLFLYSMSVQTGSSTGDNAISANTPQIFGWKQLTTTGANRNPKALCDKFGTLHVVWDGDRSGITQIFYGVAGPSARSSFNASLAAQIDKDSSSIIEDNINVNKLSNQKDFDKLDEKVLMEIIPASAVAIDKLADDDTGEVDIYAPNTQWVAYESAQGNVAVFDNTLMSVSGNASKDEAISFVQIDREEDQTRFTNNFRQRSFGVSFDLEDNNPTPILTDKGIQDEYDYWVSQFTSNESELFSNQPVYEVNGNKMVVSRRDRYYDRFIPFVGSYKNEGLIDKYTTGEAQTNDQFTVEVYGNRSTLRHFMFGLMPEKVKFAATNIESLTDFAERLGLSIPDAENIYNSRDEQLLLTGRYKLFVVMNVINKYFGSPRRANFALSRTIGEPFTLDTLRHFDIVAHYSKMLNEDSEAWNGRIYDGTSPDSRFLMSLFLAVDGQPVFGESGMVDLTDGYEYFDIGLGIPGGERFVSHVFEPYETMTYDNTAVDWTFSDVSVGVPQYSLNDNIVSYDDEIRITSSMSQHDEKDVFSSYNFDDYYGYVNLGLENNAFPYLVLTRNGYNRNPSIAEGKIASDIHIAYQSNRERYWDIYYLSNFDRSLPFRHDVRITATESNSISPDIALSRNGQRLIVWQDDRDGEYQIYSARTII